MVTSRFRRDSFLICTALTGANLTDTFQQLVKVILTEWMAVFHHLIIKYKAFLDVLLERFSRPLAESGRFLGIDPVADCDNGIKVIMLCLIVFTVCGSYREFLGN